MSLFAKILHVQVQVNIKLSLCSNSLSPSPPCPKKIVNKKEKPTSSSLVYEESNQIKQKIDEIYNAINQIKNN